MEMYPPNPSFYKQPSHFDIDGTAEFEKGKKSGIMEDKVRVKPRSANRKENLKVNKNVPKKIVYPEDKLRRRFYKDHPFETANPISLIQGECKEDRWDSISGSSVGMNGESVIRKQLYLMNKGVPEEEAYQQVIKEYYRVKADQELERKIAAQEAEQHGMIPMSRLYSNVIMNFEEKQLKMSKKVISRNAQLRQSQQAATEKSFTK
ncbi:hypothetical protein BB559_006106 [Furculomyces boomerangus]|nr:hypothetical protein BB559_006106 [Furculomyces boomerangus]